MTIISGYFDELQFWNSAYFGKFEIKDTELIIPVRQIEISERHPLNNSGIPLILPEGKLIFRGVQKSERIISEYIGDPKDGAGFKPSYKISDDRFMKNDRIVETFVLEGILENPLAWITWEIDSVSFQFELTEF